MTPALAAVEAERAILGAVLVSPGIFSGVALESRDFALAPNRTVWTALRRLEESGRPLDLVTLRADLVARGELQAAGGVEYLAGLLDGVPRVSGAEAVESWRDLVRDRAQKRIVFHAGERMQSLARGEATAHEVLDEGQRLIQEAASAIGSLVDLDTGAQISEAVRAFETAGQEAPGWRTGIPALDARLGRLQPGWLVVVGARTSVGKSSLLVNVAEAIAAQGGPVLFFSAEMTARELNQRRLLSEARIPAWRFEPGGPTPTPRDWEQLTRAASTLANRPLHIVASAPTPSEARAMARQVKARRGLAAVVFDYLQLFPAGAGRRGETREAEVARTSRSMKRMAQELGVVVIAASQINRSPEAGAKPRAPRLSDLRESGSQEQEADVVVLLHRDEGEEESTEAIVAKHRHRARGTARLGFTGACYRFTDEGEP